MKLKVANERLLFLSMFSYLILITIGFITTNIQSRIFIEPVRISAALALILFLGLSLTLRNVNGRHLIGLLLLFIFLLWGIILSLINNSYEVVSNDLFVNALVVFTGTFLFCSFRGEKILPQLMLVYFVAYVFLGLISTILIGGLVFDYPPHFNFEYASGYDQVLYSQGVSKFFGFGVIASVFLAVTGNRKVWRCVAAFLALMFAALSLLGGARGDSVFSIVVLLGYLIFRKPIATSFFLVLFFLVLYFVVNDWSWVDDFIIFERLTGVASDFGQRDILLSQSLSLLSNEPRCLIFGCGFGYFQSYYGYEFGMYPHNVLAEFLIVFGLPVMVLTVFIVIGGLRLFIRHAKGRDAFLIFGAYFFLISLKSGSLLSEWFLIASALFFSSVYIQFLINTTEKWPRKLNNAISGNFKHNAGSRSVWQ